ncbi:MAG: hypothetical protein HY427_01870 [Candidatus Levybacteria bacterium]|nr:hypothetical protein [Candidatus Levybacteria bacterium]
MVRPGDLVISVRDLGNDDLHIVGAKGVNLNEGFAVTHHAYFRFLRDNKLDIKIKHLLESVNFARGDSVEQVSVYIKNLITSSKMPDNIIYRIFGYYQDIKAPNVTLHFFIVSGDPLQSSILREQIHGISGEAVLFDTIRSLWSILFEPQLLLYRHNNNLEHLKTGASVIVEKE